MSSLTLDQKYAALVDELAQQNATFKAFLNGAEDETVYLDSNQTVKTLKGTIKDITRFQYVQKVIDHRLYSDMVAADATIAVGLLVRVWGDTTGINGLYRKDATATYTKVSYQDLYDLRDVLPNPWNYTQVLVDETKTNAIVPLVTFQVPVTASNIVSKVLRGNYSYEIQANGFQGAIAADFNIVVASKDAATIKVQLVNRQVADVEAGITTLTQENIQVTRVSDLNTHTFTVSFVPPADTGTYVIGALDVRFNGTDTSIKRV